MLIKFTKRFLNPYDNKPDGLFQWCLLSFPFVSLDDNDESYCLYSHLYNFLRSHKVTAYILEDK